MIAVIMVIILTVKGSLEYRVFSLLPCLGSGLHNPHPSHGQGSKITTQSWECSRCPKSPKNKCFICPEFASLMVLNMMNFTFLKQALHILAAAGVSWEKAADAVLSPNALMVKRQ